MHMCQHDRYVVAHVSQALKPDGGWLVFDMRGNPTPADNLRDPQLQMVAPVLYGFSVHVCLPSGSSFLPATSCLLCVVADGDPLLTWGRGVLNQGVDSASRLACRAVRGGRAWSRDAGLG